MCSLRTKVQYINLVFLHIKDKLREHNNHCHDEVVINLNGTLYILQFGH